MGGALCLGASQLAASVESLTHELSEVEAGAKEAKERKAQLQQQCAVRTRVRGRGRIHEGGTLRGAPCATLPARLASLNRSGRTAHTCVRATPCAACQDQAEGAHLSRCGEEVSSVRPRAQALEQEVATFASGQKARIKAAQEALKQAKVRHPARPKARSEASRADTP